MAGLWMNPAGYNHGMADAGTAATGTKPRVRSYGVPAGKRLNAMSLLKNFCLLALLLSAVSCSKDFPITLPAHEPQLVVECYLEDGQPLRALVTESTALLDTSLIPPIIQDAIVTITHAGRTDTLRPCIYADTFRSRIYNYGSSTIVRADFRAGTEYRIRVIDGRGRQATGVTRFMIPAAIAKMESSRNDEGEVSILTTIADDPASKNYYRLVLKRNSDRDSIQLNSAFNDELSTAQGAMIIRSRHRFNPGDTVYATLFHLTPEHYQFLNTSQGASSALGNPFAASGEVVSNISGGLGVFAALTFTERRMRVE